MYVGWVERKRLGVLAQPRKRYPSVAVSEDTSKANLDVAVHNRTERWQAANALPGWRTLVVNLTRIGVTRIGIEATGGYERGVVEHLRAAGFTVLMLQPIQVKAFGRVHLRNYPNSMKIM